MAEGQDVGAVFGEVGEDGACAEFTLGKELRGLFMFIFFRKEICMLMPLLDGMMLLSSSLL